MICQHCGKVLSNEKLAFCNFCGYPLKGENRGFFARSEETGTSRAEDYAASAAQTAPAPAPMPQQPPPQVGMMPNGMPQQPQMNVMPNGMPQMGVMPGMMPQQPQMGVMPGMMPQQQMGMMPNMMPQQQMGMMPNMMPQQQVGMMPNMMPQQPQIGVMPGMMPGAVPPVMDTDGGMAGYAMPQMYGMPQLAGYDTAGNPLYIQMMPQLIGYDPYGNPLYTMVAVPCQMPMLNPQQPTVIPLPMQPPQDTVVQQPAPMPTAYAYPAPQTEAYAQPVPQTEAYTQPAPQPEAYAQPAPQPEAHAQSAPQPEAHAQPAPQPETHAQPAPQPEVPVEHVVEVSGSEDIPLSADALMNEPVEDTAPAGPQMPDEQELLDRIFSDAPKGYTMSEGTAPSEHVFSISLGSDEVTSVADEETPPPKPKRSASKSKEEKAEKAEKTEKTEKGEKKPASRKKGAAPKKPPVKIISPDEFFDDKPKGRDTLGMAELEKLNDEQLVAQLNAMNGGTKAHRSIMRSASLDEIDLTNAVDMPDVTTSLPH